MQISAPHDFPAALIIVVHIPQSAYSLLPRLSHVPYIVHMVLAGDDHVKILDAYGFLHIQEITAYLVVVAVCLSCQRIVLNGVSVNILRSYLSLVKGHLGVI